MFVFFFFESNDPEIMRKKLRNDPLSSMSRFFPKNFSFINIFPFERIIDKAEKTFRILIGSSWFIERYNKAFFFLIDFLLACRLR